MRLRTFKPIFWLFLLILVVGLACGGPPAEEPTAVPAEDPVEQPVEKPTDPPAKKDEVVEPDIPEDTGAISDIKDVQGAVIQIEAQGTFVDPESGAYSGAGRGTGFIIDPSGIAVTNNHVVTGAALLKVWVGGDTSKTYNARILGVSECSDLAVIDIEGEDFPFLEWYDQPVQVGLDVYTAGFPLGEPEYTLTKGIVSKESADGETNWASVDSVIMHDATINPGNSGGPLVTADGKVVAVNYAAFKSADQYFAIGQDVAIPVIEQLTAGDDVDSIGVNGMAFVNDDGTFAGVWVNSVESGSPADQAGITGGDIIMELEGFPIAADGTMQSYCDIVRTHNTEDTVGVKVFRYTTAEDLEGQLNGDPLEVVVTYGDGGEDTGDTGGDTEDTADASGYAAVYDDTNAIGVEVPTDWAELDGRIWENTWGTQDFTAASIVATPDMEAYNNFNGPGVWYAASEDWGNLGGYVQLLDGVKGWYQDECDFVERGDYGDEDPIYEGGYDLWEDCGAGSAYVWIIAARPKADPLAYLSLVQIQLLPDDAADIYYQILNTFDKVGPLP